MVMLIEKGLNFTRKRERESVIFNSRESAYDGLRINNR